MSFDISFIVSSTFFMRPLPGMAPAQSTMFQPAASIPPPTVRPAMAPGVPSMPVLGAQHCPRPRPVNFSCWTEKSHHDVMRLQLFIYHS